MLRIGPVEMHPDVPRAFRHQGKRPEQRPRIAAARIDAAGVYDLEEWRTDCTVTLAPGVVLGIEPVEHHESGLAVCLSVALCPRLRHRDDGAGGGDDPALQAGLQGLPPGRPGVVGVVRPAIPELGDPGDPATRRQELAYGQAGWRRAACVDEVRTPAAKQPATGAPGIRQPADACIGPVEAVGVKRRCSAQQGRATASWALRRGRASAARLESCRRRPPEGIA